MPIIEPEFLELTRDLDIQAFWKENDACLGFRLNKPRCSMGFSPDDHWLFEFLSIPSTLRYYHDKLYRDSLHREVDALLRQYVGRAYFDEDTWETSPKRIENLFGCEFAYYEGGTPWLMPVTDDPDVFSRVLDQAERVDIRTWALPEPFLAEWEQRKQAGKPLPRLGDGSRGPATVMTSILKPETLFYWSVDHPDLLRRFSDLLAAKMIELNTVLREFSGFDRPDWWITDDNCALFNRRLYHAYCFPVLERVLNRFAPTTAEQGSVVAPARRFQHSDSSMAHLLDEQSALGITEVNYGPNVDAGLIRQKLPRAMIFGQMPPMLLRNGTPDEIRQRVREDFCKAGATGGLEIATAGSLAAGTGLGRMRWLMQVVQEETRYR